MKAIISASKALRSTLLLSILAVPSLATAASWQEQDQQTQSGEEAIDFVIQDVCVDGNNLPITGDPTSCWPRRNLRIGEPVPYLRTDFAPGGQRPQALASVPVPGRDGTLKVLVSKNFSGGNRDANYQFLSWNNAAVGDGYDLMETNGQYFGFQRTFDGGCFDQFFNEDGWVSFDRGNFNSSTLLPITLTRSSPRPGCDAVSQGYAYTVFDRVDIGYTSGRVMDTIVSHHFADQDLSRPLENALEKYYFTKQLGFTRWEAWVPLARCQRDSPSQCSAETTNQRCNGDAFVNVGGNTWVRTDCRDSTNISMLKTPFLPLNGDMAASDIDMQSAFQSDSVANLIRQLAIDVLGRDPASLTPSQARANWGALLGTPYDVRITFANSEEAGVRIRQLAIDLLGRAPSLTPAQAKQYWGGILINGGTLQDIRQSFANSEEAAVRIRQLAINLLGRDPALTTAQARSNWGLILTNGGTLTDVSRIFTASDEASARIRQLAIDVLGRDPALTTAQARSNWGAILTNGGTLVDVRRIFAESEEASGRIRRLAIDVLGRDPALTTAQARSNWGSILTNGGSLADVRRIFATSLEATMLVRNLLIEILGRAPTSAELATYQNQLASGAKTIASVRAERQEALAIRGHIDNITVAKDGSTASIRGWACARQTPRSITVHVYAGSNSTNAIRVTSGLANIVHESGVSAACNDPSNTPHRFEIVLSNALRSQFSGKLIYVYGISPFPGYKNLLLNNSGKFEVPAPGLIKLEAENAAQLPVDQIKREASGLRYVELNKTGVRALRFPLKLDKARRYRIEASSRAKDGNSDSFVIISSLEKVAVRVPQAPTWIRAYGIVQGSTKRELAEISLPAGVSVLKILVRENGLQLDSFKLVPIQPDF